MITHMHTILLHRVTYRWLDGKDYDYRGNGSMAVSRDTPDIIKNRYNSKERAVGLLEMEAALCHARGVAYPGK